MAIPRTRAAACSPELRVFPRSRGERKRWIGAQSRSWGSDVAFRPHSVVWRAQFLESPLVHHGWLFLLAVCMVQWVCGGHALAERLLTTPRQPVLHQVCGDFYRGAAGARSSHPRRVQALTRSQASGKTSFVHVIGNGMVRSPASHGLELYGLTDCAVERGRRPDRRLQLPEGPAWKHHTQDMGRRWPAQVPLHVGALL